MQTFMVLGHLTPWQGFYAWFTIHPIHLGSNLNASSLSLGRPPSLPLLGTIGLHNIVQLMNLHGTSHCNTLSSFFNVHAKVESCLQWECMHTDGVRLLCTVRPAIWSRVVLATRACWSHLLMCRLANAAAWRWLEARVDVMKPLLPPACVGRAVLLQTSMTCFALDNKNTCANNTQTLWH